MADSGGAEGAFATPSPPPALIGQDIYGGASPSTVKEEEGGGRDTPRRETLATDRLSHFDLVRCPRHDEGHLGRRPKQPPRRRMKTAEPPLVSKVSWMDLLGTVF